MLDGEQQLCVLVLRPLLEQIHITHVSAAFVINESFLMALNLIRGFWERVRIKEKSRVTKERIWSRRLVVSGVNIQEGWREKSLQVILWLTVSVV